MGGRLFAMGVVTTCLSVVGLLLNRPTTPAYVASVLALCSSLVVVIVSFVAPLALRSVLPPGPGRQAIAPRGSRAERRRAAGQR